MAQPLQLNIHYPFGNPNKQPSEDAESYHSLTLDDKKLNYFDQQTDQSLSRIPQANLKRKNPLPPSYPYEQVKKLKHSLSLKNKSKLIPDSQSINSADSFHTANEFQSICYEEGDFQKIMRQMQNPNPLQPESVLNSNQQNDISNKENHPSLTSSKLSRTQQKQTNQKIQSAISQAYVPMQQSEALKDFDIEDLQNQQSDGQKYEAFEANELNQENSKNLFEKHQQNDEEREVQISQIENALNQSELIDQEILELTRQLQIIHSSQENLMQQKHFSEQFSQKQQIIAQKYFMIESRLKQLQSVQKNFTSKLSNMHQLMKKTQKNNSYLQKELEFFKQKSKEFQEKERIIQEKQQLLKNKQLNTSKSHSLSLNQQKTKPKTYHIKPKVPNNQSIQSRKYKELTFDYCLGANKLETDDKWDDLQIDSQNNPAEYKLVYSFQHQNTILAVRLLDLITSESNRSAWNSRKSGSQGSTIRKNYQYLIDFADKKYQTQEDKIKSLSKELVVNLAEQKYVCKQFTRKVEVYVMISEEETYVDLVKLVPLPNPLVFYIDNRFNFLGLDDKGSESFRECQSETVQNQNQERNRKQANLMKTSGLQRSLSNLERFMKSYVIKIEQMADVQSIQKLMGLKWVNSGQSQQTKYFTIKAENNKAGKQLFFVKIEDCVLQSGPEYESLNGRHRYSLTFRVGSTYDNDLLVDLIEFLTFLTVH